MSKIKLSGVARSIQGYATKYSPELLTGVGIAGLLSTTVLAVSATPKAIRMIERAENEVDRDLTKKEIVKVTWKCYIPAAVTGVASVACLLGASKVNIRRNAALATAYTLSETALTEYKNKVVETVGEVKEKQVRDAVIKEKIEKNPVQNNEVFVTSKGETLCYDNISGRYFKSDIDFINNVKNILNQRLMSEMYISLNEFYYELGLKPIQIGNELGWNMNDGIIDIYYSSQIAEDNRPCIVVDYSVVPRFNYGSLY